MQEHQTQYNRNFINNISSTANYDTSSFQPWI